MWIPLIHDLEILTTPWETSESRSDPATLINELIFLRSRTALEPRSIAHRDRSAFRISSFGKDRQELGVSHILLIAGQRRVPHQ